MNIYRVFGRTRKGNLVYSNVYATSPAWARQEAQRAWRREWKDGVRVVGVRKMGGGK